MLRMYFLGMPEFYDEDENPIELPTRKTAHLLALLWLNRDQPQSRARVAGLLWPESDEKKARGSLNQALHRLRGAIDTDGRESLILSDHHSLQFNADVRCWVDAEEFERRVEDAASNESRVDDLEAAADLYRGDLVVDCYDDWCLVERDRLRSLYLSCLRELMSRFEEAGDDDKVIDYAKRVLAVNPLQEDAHYRLIHIYHAQGDRGAAVAQYRDCQQRLEDELGIEPSTEVQDLFQTIMDEGGSMSTERARPMDVSRSRTRTDSNSVRAIAVLPFINMSPEIDNEYFCDGLTEELINALTKVHHLRVAAQTSVFTVKGTTDDVRQIGHRLNVDTVLEGSVRRTGDKLRINALMSDVESGYHLWSEQFDRELADIFTLQEELTRSIVSTLKDQLFGKPSSTPLIGRSTENLDAYLLYLRGRYFWHQRTEAGLEKSIDYFQQAISADPDYAQAYAGLADAYNVLGYYHFSHPEESFPKSESAAEKALSLDDTLAEAHASLGLARDYAWDWPRAELAYQQALELRPGYATGHHWYALFLMNMGRLERALAEIELAHQSDPYSLPINRDWGHLLYVAREHEQALDQFQTTIEMAPDFPYAHLYLGLVHLERSAYEDALNNFAIEAELSGERDCLADALTSCAYARLGKAKEARSALQHSDDRSRDRYRSPYFVGLGWLSLGEDDRAFELFQEAYDVHDFFLSRMKVDPILDEVREDTRYRELIERLGMSGDEDDV